jgi:hypothetical protein
MADAELVIRDHPHSRSSTAHPASRVHTALVISGYCGTFPCVRSFLQNSMGAKSSKSGLLDHAPGLSKVIM